MGKRVALEEQAQRKTNATATTSLIITGVSPQALEKIF
jgi:hypothetical protein